MIQLQNAVTKNIICNLPSSLSKRDWTPAVGVGFPSLEYAIAREPSKMKENVFKILRQTEVYFQIKPRKMTLIKK